MNPHIIRRIERDGSCIYCNEKLDSGKWKSVFSQIQHYKCVLCSCGRENNVKVDFIGTGHDAWSGLEEKVAQNSSIKVIEKNVMILK